MSFAAVAAKATNSAFRARLAVAITEQCRYELGTAQGARSPERYAWDHALARQTLQLLTSEQHLTRYARICLLPAVWGAFDPDDDAALQGRVSERMPMFASDAPPA